MYIFIFNHTILNVSNLEDLKVWKYKKHCNSKMSVSRISKKLKYNFDTFYFLQKRSTLWLLQTAYFG